MLLNITKPIKASSAVLNLGFRVFFLGAAAFAVVSMALWCLVLFGKIGVTLTRVSPAYWHAHEMIFGYSCAVMAGFLLTALKEWTGLPMPTGFRLLRIFVPWTLGRFFWAAFPVAEDTQLASMLMYLAMIFDLLFWSLVNCVVVRSVLRVHQKRQAVMLFQLLVLWMCQLIFALATILDEPKWQAISLYWALFSVIGVVFIIARRVLPKFIEQGVSVNCDGQPNGVQVQLKTSPWADRIALTGLASLILSYLFCSNQCVVSFLATVVALVNIWRLVGWYHSGIWKKSLVWSLYVAMWAMVGALILMAVLPFFGQSSSLGLHVLALTGVGLMTLAMMTRVSLSHTGRNIYRTPRNVVTMFLFMLLCIAFRVVAPMFEADYLIMVAYAQVCWIISFLLFLGSYTKILTRSRIDGLAG